MAILYVDAKNGLDGNTGGTLDPLQTLAHAIGSHAANGDTLRLRGSAAYDEIYFERGISTAKTTLTIEADTGHAPVLSAGKLYTAWAKTGGATNVYEAAYTPGTCASVWNGATSLASTASVAACDGLSGSYYFDNAGDKLYVNIGGAAPTNIVVIDTNVKLLTFSGSGATVRVLNFQWCMENAIANSGGTSTIDQCNFLYNHGYSAAEDFSWVLLASATHLVRNCRFEGTYTSGSDGNNAVTVAAAGDGLTMTDCVVTGGYYGVHAKAGTNMVERCLFTGCANSSVWVDGGTTTVWHSTATDNGHDGFGSNSTGALSAYYCTVNWTYDAPAPITGAQWGFVIHAAGVLYHCVVANMKRSTKGDTAYDMATGGAVTLKNCIAYNCQTGIRDSGGGPPVPFDADYNCFWFNDTNYGLGFSAGSHDALGDPRFVGAVLGQDDFRLGPGSACIDAGINVAGVTEGFRGTAPDIGRYEYVQPVVHRRRR